MNGCTKITNVSNVFQIKINQSTLDSNSNWSTLDIDLADNCCENMFAFCTNIESIPSVLVPNPFDNIITFNESCYKGMFKYCLNVKSNSPETNLFEIPSDVSGILNKNCFNEMFSSCLSFNYSNLNLKFNILPESCFREMFLNCRSLTRITLAPEFNSISNYACSNMFTNCKELIYCSELVVSSNIAEINGSMGFENMFSGCSKLNKISAYFYDDWLTNYFNFTPHWLKAVSTQRNHLFRSNVFK